MEHSDEASPELPERVTAGLAEHSRHLVFDAADDDGCTLSIVEIAGNRCTMLVHETGAAKASTIVLTLDQLGDMAHAVGGWVQRKG